MIKSGFLILATLGFAFANTASDSVVIATGKMSSHSYSEFNIRNNKDVSIAKNFKENIDLRLVKFNGKYYCNLIIGGQELSYSKFGYGKTSYWYNFINPETGCCVRVQQQDKNVYTVMVIDMTAFNVHIFYGTLTTAKFE